MKTDNSAMDPFVDWEWCASNMDRIVLVDTRWYLDGSSGKAAYDAGHIPESVFMDMDQWLTGPASKEKGRNPLPDPEVFAEGMRQAGISDSDVVVAYDDAGGVIAARLVWMLRATGHSAAVLNGGLASYPGTWIPVARKDQGVVSQPRLGLLHYLRTFQRRPRIDTRWWMQGTATASRTAKTLLTRGQGTYLGL